MKFLDLDYSKKIYLVVLYDSVLQEIEEGKRHGAIVRQLVKEGENVQLAEQLYQLIYNQKETVKELSDKLKAELVESKKKLIKYNDQYSAPPALYNYNQQEADHMAFKVCEAALHYLLHRLLF